MSFKPLIIIILFEILDFIKLIIKQFFPFIYLDFVFVLGITATYYYGFLYGIIIFILGIINRAIMSCLEQRHLKKIIRHIPIFYLLTIFKNLNSNNFFYISFILLILNYILKYGLKIAKQELEFEKTPFHLINFILATLFFYIVSILYEYLPYLK